MLTVRYSNELKFHIFSFHIHMHKSIQVGYTVKFDHRKFIGQFNNVLKLWQADSKSEPKLCWMACCFDFYDCEWQIIYKKLIRRWDSERELSLRRHCTRTKKTIDSCINCAIDRFLQRKFTKFSEITQCNRHYAVQGHSRSPILVPIESSYTTSY